MAFLTLVQPAQEPVTAAQLVNFGRLSSNLATADAALIASLITAAREWCESYCERAFVFQTKRLEMDFFPGYVDFKLAGQRVSSPFVSGANAVLVGIRYAIALPWPQARQVVNFTYIDPNGNLQTMELGESYLADLDSQPARITPNVTTGQMWPVARVQPNAVTVDYLTGYWGSIPVSMTNGSAVLTSTFIFLPRDVGAAISIPAAVAGSPATALATTIASVDVNGVATLAVAATASTGAQTTSFGVMPMSVQLAIMLLALQWYENRIPDMNDIPLGVKALLYPYRDLRL